MDEALGMVQGFQPFLRFYAIRDALRLLLEHFREFQPFLRFNGNAKRAPVPRGGIALEVSTLLEIQQSS